MSSTSKKKLPASDWCGRRETDTKPLLYLSGAPTPLHMTEEEFQKVIQYPYRCFTYPYIGDKSPFLQKRFRACFEWSLANGGRIMLDSGAHTFHTRMYAKGGGSRTGVKAISRIQMRRKAEQMAEGFLADYIKWLANYPAGSFDFYVTFDWQPKCQLVYDVTKQMQQQGVRPIPAYHGDSSMDWLRRYVDEGHQLVGIGWSTATNGRVQRQRYYDQVFNFAGKHALALHGFACTGRDMFNYPWYCMTDRHTVLTKQGWRSREELQVGQEVLTFRVGRSEWKPIKNIHTFSVCDIPIRKYSGKFSAEVTLNHKWWVKRMCDDGTHVWEWRETEDFSLYDRIPRIARYLDAPKHPCYTDELVALVAWVWTDGSVTLSNRDKRLGAKTPGVTIYQCQKKHPQHVIRIRSLLQSMGTTWSESITKEATGGETVVFYVSGVAKKQVACILGVPKTLSFDFVLSLTQKQLHLFIGEVLKGDSSQEARLTGPPVFDLSQKHGTSIQSFKLACVLAGIPFSSYEDASLEHVHSSNSGWLTPKACKQQSDRMFSGVVWCIEVDNHTFFTRCDGSYYWTGNSVDSSSWLKAAVFGKIFRIKQTSGHIKLDPVDVSTRRLDIGFLRGQTVDSVLNFCSMDPIDLRESTKARALYNVGIMKEMLELVQSRNSRIPWEPLF